MRPQLVPLWYWSPKSKTYKRFPYEKIEYRFGRPMLHRDNYPLLEDSLKAHFYKPHLFVKDQWEYYYYSARKLSRLERFWKENNDPFIRGAFIFLIIESIIILCIWFRILSALL